MSFVGTAELTNQQAELFAYTFRLDERRVAEIRQQFTHTDLNAISRTHGYPSRYFRCNNLLLDLRQSEVLDAELHGFAEELVRTRIRLLTNIKNKTG